MKTAIIVVILLALLGGGVWYWHNSNGQQVVFRTVSVQRGELQATISATGTIEPEEVVDIGAQVAGMIKEFGRDPHVSSKPIDYGSVVEDGTILAQIDESLFQARVDKAQAQVDQAQAQIEQADADLARVQADLLQTQAKYRQADRDWERAQRLSASRAIAEADSDLLRANYEVAKANQAVAEASIKQSKAAKLRAEKLLSGAQADLKEAQKNLGYTTIRAPVKGVIIDRRVNVGQTVVASLNAPSLFLIAKDLTRMQVWASVNEADIGQIHAGQAVHFTVDAYPDTVFRGEVAQIRLNASMTQNVVTYTVVVATDNSSGKLLPYLTANVQFEIDQRSNALLVPNAALRWRPQPQSVVPEAREAFIQSTRRRQSAAGDGKAAAKPEKERQDRGTLWMEDGDFVRPVEVRIGLSDGMMTEITRGDIQEGTAIVVGESRRGNGVGTSNPFTPKMFGPGKTPQ